MTMVRVLQHTHSADLVEEEGRHLIVVRSPPPKYFRWPSDHSLLPLKKKKTNRVEDGAVQAGMQTRRPNDNKMIAWWMDGVEAFN